MLKLFGQPRHEGDGFFPNRAYLLIGVLTFAPERSLSRTTLATSLWELSSSAHALSNLRYVLSQVRKWEELNQYKVLKITNGRVALHGEVASDVDRFLRIPSVTNTAEMTELLDLWSGEFFEGEDIPGEDLDIFVRSTRDRMTRRFIDLALDAVANIGGRQVEPLMLRMLRLAPFDEEVARANLLYLVSMGRTEEATSYYRDFCHRLRVEMDAEVELDTRTLASQLLPRIGQSIPRYPANAHPPANTVDADTVGAPKELASTGVGLPRVLILPPTPPMRGVASVTHTFARTIVSDLTLYLGKMRTFAVIAPFTARHIDAADPLAAAMRIDASYVVTTRIVPSAPNALLAFALMESRTGEILLADTLPIAPRTLETTEAALAESLAASIANRISGSELLRYRQTGEASAFAHYLLGVERLRYDLPAIRKARKHFQRAVALAPNFAPAISMTARTLNYEWLVLGRTDNDILRSALTLAAQAAELDPLNPVGHWEIGHSLLYLNRLDESLQNIERATERAPHLADLLADKADVLVHIGEFDRALEAIGRATALNPVTPDEYLWVRGSAQYFLGNYRQAVATLGGMRDTEPVSRLMAASAAMAGDLDTAARYRKNWLARYPEFRLQDWVTQIPLKDPATQEHMLEGMRRAGFR